MTDTTTTTRDPKQLPPDPDGMNDRRAVWAGDALAAFIDAIGADEGDALSDLLCDLMHLCDRDADLGGFETQLGRARGHYEAETGGEDIPWSSSETADAEELLAAGRVAGPAEGAGVPADPVAGSAPTMAPTTTNGVPA